MEERNEMDIPKEIAEQTRLRMALRNEMIAAGVDVSGCGDEQEGGEWEPIETAPMDGTAILVFGGGRIAVAMWFFDTDWASVEPIRGDPLNEPPTHWMPLPKPPNYKSPA